MKKPYKKLKATWDVMAKTPKQYQSSLDTNFGVETQPLPFQR